MANQGPWGGGGGNSGGDDGDDGKQPSNRPWGDQRPPRDPQRPERPGQGGDSIPEIEELMKKGQERLRVLMGGGRGGNRQNGGGGGGSGSRGPDFRLNRSTLGLAGLGLLALWAFASFYTVKPEERGVEFLFGDEVGIGEPGLNFAPWPFVTAEIVQVTGERVTELGTGTGPMDSGLMLTRDQNIVDMEYQVVWNISDPAKYLFNLADPRDTIRAVSESAMRGIIARSELAPILNRDRGTIAEDLQSQVQQTLNAYESGINIVRVNLDRADPPQEVIDAFREVQAAQQERDRLEKEADAYANRVLANARGEAAAQLEQAEAYRAQAVNVAEGEAARFNSVYEEYVKAPDVTRRRMYLETMERVLGDVDKVILDGTVGANGSGGGVVPYLPLDQLRRGSSAGTGNANTQGGSAATNSTASGGTN